MQESRIDDYWNIDRSRDLSDSWTGFTQFSLLKEKPPDGYTWSGKRLTKRQATSRPDHLWPEIWRSMSRNTKLKEKQNWAGKKKPKLDNTRRLRGIYFLDPEAIEFKETVKNARRKLKVPTVLAMPCKKTNNRHGETCDKKGIHKSQLACILEVSESTRLRMERILPKNHEDHIAGRGNNSLHLCNVVRKFIAMPQAMEIPAAKAAADKEWEKLEKIPAWNLTLSETNPR